MLLALRLRRLRLGGEAALEMALSSRSGLLLLLLLSKSIERLGSRERRLLLRCRLTKPAKLLSTRGGRGLGGCQVLGD